ncbi:hypothetical protein H0H81_002221 [Sphagnurus paluster]|uniref:Uncharacterized protein n=1 Tax=Sphagnurus paluster TaxID=117069 RepID=A0A9P7FZD1_9AGAR|nr:hypothetical protein H0H81_002221 [Sphagnurus paluster]
MPTVFLMKQGHGPNPLFNNHWGLLVHTSGTPVDKNLTGTFLHVHGSVAAGFAFEAKRGWVQAVCPDPYRALVLGEVTSGSVEIGSADADGMPGPDEEEHGWVMDPEPRTDFERALLKAPPPGPTLKSAVSRPVLFLVLCRVAHEESRSQVAARGAKAQLQDCQEWIRMALPHAVDEGFTSLFEDVQELLSVKNQ